MKTARLILVAFLVINSCGDKYRKINRDNLSTIDYVQCLNDNGSVGEELWIRPASSIVTKVIKTKTEDGKVTVSSFDKSTDQLNIDSIVDLFVEILDKAQPEQDHSVCLKTTEEKIRYSYTNGCAWNMKYLCGKDLIQFRGIQIQLNQLMGDKAGWKLIGTYSLKKPAEQNVKTAKSLWPTSNLMGLGCGG